MPEVSCQSPEAESCDDVLLPCSRFLGIMAKEMEIIIMGYIGIIGYILGLYLDTGKENGNHYLL